MNNTLITGANGLAGSEFDDNHIKITSKDCDLRIQSSVDELFGKYSSKVENVIHCAAKVGGIGGNMNHMGEFFYDNIMINTNVIESCRKHNIKKLMVFSSTCVFPDKVEYPLTEEKVHLGPPHESNYGYGYAKRMTDIQIKSYNQQYGTKYFSAILCNMYGPNDNYHIENGHIIPALIHKIHIANKTNRNLEVWGTGKPLREFIFSRDVANISKILIEKYDDIKPIIVSPSQEVSIEEVVYTIAKQMGFKNRIVFDKSKPDGQLRKPSDNSYLKSIIGDYEFKPFDEGISETIEYFIKNYDRVRK